MNLYDSIFEVVMLLACVYLSLPATSKQKNGPLSFYQLHETHAFKLCLFLVFLDFLLHVGVELWVAKLVFVVQLGTVAGYWFLTSMHFNDWWLKAKVFIPLLTLAALLMVLVLSSATQFHSFSILACLFIATRHVQVLRLRQRMMEQDLIMFRQKLMEQSAKQHNSKLWDKAS